MLIDMQLATRISTLLICILLSTSMLASCKKAPVFIGIQNTPATTQSSGQSSTQASDSPFNFAPTVRVTKDAIKQEGSIVFIEERGQPDFRLAKFDLETQELTTVFQIPDGGWVYQLDANENQQLVMSYTEPSEGISFDRSGIYLLDTTSDAAQPELLVGSDKAFVYYYDPVFSVTNDFVYYLVSDPVKTSLRVERINIQSKAIDVIAENALWPKVSPDGTSLVYLAIDRETQERSLIKTALDGSNTQTLIAENQLEDLDLPFFSADGEWVYISVPEEQTDQSSIWHDLILQGLLGIAYAHGNHDVPANWWRVSVNSGEAEQVSTESVIHYFGDMSTNNTLAYTASKGFYVFDGIKSTLFLSSRAIRAFTWLE